MVTFLAMVLSAWMTSPLLSVLSNHSIDLGDSLLTAYLHAWDVHALLSHPASLFDTNMFYPAKNTLALSENLLGDQIFFAPVYLLSGNPLLANNIVVFLSFVLGFLAMYWLIKWATGSSGAGIVAATVFVFAPARVSQLGHTQLLSTQWLPVIVLFFFRFLARRKTVDVALFGLAVLLQILCSLYLGYFALLTAASFFVAVLLVRPAALRRRVIIGITAAAIVVASLIYPLLRPYQKLQGGALHQEYQLQLDASASPRASYLHTHGHAYHDLLKRFHAVNFDWEKQLFVGFLTLTLAMLTVIGFAATWLKRPAPGSTDRTSGPPGGFFLGSVILTFSAYVLSLGPVLHVHDAPTGVHLPFYYLCKWVPGFASFRAPARFGILVMFGMAMLAGMGFVVLERQLTRFASLKRYAGVGLAALLVFGILQEFRYAPFPFPPAMTAATLKPEYRWLAQQPIQDAILELPIRNAANGAPDPFEGARRTYASAFHWHPLVNGYSGHAPVITPSMYELGGEMPSAEAADLLAGLGVSYVFLHTDEMTPAEIARWTPNGLPAHIRKIARFEGTEIFQLYSSDCTRGVGVPGIVHLQAPTVAPASGKFPFEVSVDPGQTCWVDPSNGGEHAVVAEWRKDGSSKFLRVEQQTQWPVYAGIQETSTMPEEIRAPQEPGTYFLTLRFASPSVDLAQQRVTFVKASEAVNSSASGLSASYDLQSLRQAGDRVLVQFRVTNTGSAVWHVGARPQAIRLGYVWFDAHHKPVSDGRLEFPYDLYPGMSYTFDEYIKLPATPGNYVLKLELVDELVTWFNRLGIKPVEVPVVRVERQEGVN